MLPIPFYGVDPDLDPDLDLDLDLDLDPDLDPDPDYPDLDPGVYSPR